MEFQIATIWVQINPKQPCKCVWAMLISVQRLDLAILGFQILHNLNPKIWKMESKKIIKKTFFLLFWNLHQKVLLVCNFHASCSFTASLRYFPLIFGWKTTKDLKAVRRSWSLHFWKHSFSADFWYFRVKFWWQVLQEPENRKKNFC